MRALIIDDERLARDELRRLLLEHPQVEIVGEAAGVQEGLQQIARLSPELIFLDVQMPDGSGFDLLTALEQPPAVIFTTAYDRYAIRAFDVSALDYLLKPVDPPRLAQALQKRLPAPTPASAPMPAATAAAAAAASTPPPDGKVFIKDGERCWFVALDDIVLFESEGNYTRVYFDHHRPLLLRSLSQMEARLDAAKFMRVSRSQIVNLARVTGIAPAPAGGMALTLQGDLRVGMSRRRAILFKQLNRL
ncbi:two component transcriptional regulator LytTr family [Janthinobacterium sp. HH01]|uniref:LytR/AlgR family response regulator transcription factor n=1 Tax=Janthinobacterium sp. HH01 TaxID=1198452 RepID=UPI0002AEAB3D|nr:LytTR family DNA-binding domain-containing protein [Janthinobacterium sp. HH01]ELX12024.1 two component transcriptional regulator LytTr family [Janthinobacterium sp. HH01]